MADQSDSRAYQGNIFPASWVSEAEENILGKIELELAYEILDQNMGIADIRNAFRSAAGKKLKLDGAFLRYENNRQIMDFVGNHDDGKPFDVSSKPFDDDPNVVAQLIASEIIAAREEGRPMNSSILGAGYLGQRARQRVADAKARLAKAGDKFEGAIGQAESAAGNLEGVATQIEKEAADLTATAAQLTNGPPSDEPA